MGQWTRVENNNEVFLRVTNHTGQAEKNLLGPDGIRTRDLRFTSPMLYQLSYSWFVSGLSLGETPHYYTRIHLDTCMITVISCHSAMKRVIMQAQPKPSLNWHITICSRNITYRTYKYGAANICWHTTINKILSFLQLFNTNLSNCLILLCPFCNCLQLFLIFSKIYSMNCVYYVYYHI